MMSSKPNRVIGDSNDQNYSSSSINGQYHFFQDGCVKAYKSMVLDEAKKLYDYYLIDRHHLNSLFILYVVMFDY